MTWSLNAARGYCARLTRSQYENFSVVSILLPRPLLPHFHAVYAFCRVADDLADTSRPGDQTLAGWRDELERCYEGSPHHPITVALAATIQRFRIPKTPFLDLLSAFEQDQRVNRYRTFDELVEYCRRSAHPVGHLVLHLGECFDPERAALSDDICTGLQLANFCQDVRRDWEGLGRIYLPEEDRRRFGYADDQWSRFTPAFAELMKFEVNRTRELFERGRPLLLMLPRSLRGQVQLFLHGGLAVLDGIERQGYDVWLRRPTVSKTAKTRLLIQALGGRLWDRLRFT